MFPRLNKPYIAGIAIIGTAGLAFIAWMTTSQVYGQWSLGLPRTGGWTWPMVLSIDLLCLLGAAALYWKIYADARTIIDDTGIRRPTLRGPKHLKWHEVKDMKVFRGTGFHVYGSGFKVVVTPYVYLEPEVVIEAIQRYSAPFLSRSAA